MPRYVVERVFADTWDIGADGEERCRQIVEGNGDDVTWLHSYVSEDGRRAFCMYEAPSPESIRKSAARNELPIESITCVRVLDPYTYREALRC
jgi:Nickel responsive protein SCO4226-like